MASTNNEEATKAPTPLQSSSVSDHDDGTQQNNVVGDERQPKLGDGCYHVFLDVGSNIGVHARFLYEPDLFPEPRSSVATFAKEFGYPRDK